MANLDTKAKRASSIAISFQSPGPGHAFATNGLSAAERQVAGYGYFGIAADAPVVVETTTTRFATLIPMISMIRTI